MKNSVVVIVAFTVGGAFAIFNELLLPLWCDLGWRKPVSDWLVSLDFGQLAAYWGLVWINLPAWCLAFILGMLTGVASRGKNWFRNAVVCGIGFMLVPHLYWLGGGHPWALFDFKIGLLTLLWNLGSVPLLLFGAWMFRRFGQKVGAGDECGGLPASKPE
jgi:hypothetical protein